MSVYLEWESPSSSGIGGLSEMMCVKLYLSTWRWPQLKLERHTPTNFWKPHGQIWNAGILAPCPELLGWAKGLFGKVLWNKTGWAWLTGTIIIDSLGSKNHGWPLSRLEAMWLLYLCWVTGEVLGPSFALQAQRERLALGPYSLPISVCLLPLPSLLAVALESSLGIP